MRLLATRSFFATPQHAIETAARRGARSSWVQPGNMVTSGAFTLRGMASIRENRTRQEPGLLRCRFGLARSHPFSPPWPTGLHQPIYTGLVKKAALCMPMSPHLMAGISGMRDVRKCPNFGAHFPVMNTRKPPFNDVRVRYALNMATDKHAIAAFFGDGRTPLKGVVPPLDGYEPAKESSGCDGWHDL